MPVNFSNRALAEVSDAVSRQSNSGLVAARPRAIDPNPSAARVECRRCFASTIRNNGAAERHHFFRDIVNEIAC